MATTFKNLSPTEKEIGLALYATKLKDLGKDELTVAIAGIIGKTYLNLGWKFDKNAKDQLEMTLDELISDLQKYNGNLTIEEIKLAFNSGYKKEYGDFFGMGNATYFQWVNGYTWAEKRLRVRKTLLEAKKNENKEPEKKKPEEVDYIMRDACLKSFDDFRRGIVVFDAGNVKYNYLVKIGVLSFTNERKMEIQRLTRERLKMEALESKQKTDTVQKALSRILPDTLISESKKDALKAFFKDLTETETELSDLLH